MNKMIKGAAAVGVGVLLLVGGGGSLALWNKSETVNPGAIVAGELSLTAEAGTWTNSEGGVIDIASYKIVPGETIAYTQKLDIRLAGNKMKANLTVTAPGYYGTFTEGNIDVHDAVLYLEDANGVPSVQIDPEGLTPATLGDVHNAVASAKFTFSEAAADDENKIQELGAVTFTLAQVSLAQPATALSAP